MPNTLPIVALLSISLGLAACTAQPTNRQGVINRAGTPLTLVGTGVSEGETAPDFTVTTTDMQPVSLSDLRGRTVIISAVPSLDTETCSLQTQRFNQEAANLDADVVVLTISMDLPFAQRRWCGTHGVDNPDRMIVASDYKDHAFSEAYGLRIAELGLITRALIVVDADGQIVYEQLVNDITQEPDYAPALEAARRAAM